MKEYVIGDFQFLLAKILKRIPISNRIKYKYNELRHKRIENILLPYFRIAEKNVSNQAVQKYDGPIWLFWWQGINNMPPIIERCIQSVQENSDGRSVILVTKYNLKKYFKVPDRLIYLRQTNKISMAHFSDVIRFNLLRKYGGLWLDATILVTKKIGSEYFSKFFTCSGYEDKDYFFVTNGNWCSFLIGGGANHPVFQFMSAFYNAYWEKNDGLIDYFIIDYALKYAWQHNLGNFKKYTLAYRDKKNPDLFNLVGLLNHKFNYQKWHKLNQNTEMFKLTYKMHFSKEKNTFYDFIMKMDR